MKKTAIIISMSILFSCGSNDNIKKTTDNNQTKIEITKSEKKIEEFTIRALGNTMSEMKYDLPNITVNEGSKVKITLHLRNSATIDSSQESNEIESSKGKRRRRVTWSIVVHGENLGLLSTKLALMYPKSTIVRVKDDTNDMNAHLQYGRELRAWALASAHA